MLIDSEKIKADIKMHIKVCEKMFDMIPSNVVAGKIDAYKQMLDYIENISNGSDSNSEEEPQTFQY